VIVISAKLWLALVLAFSPFLDIGRPAVVFIAVVFGIGVVYEILRSRRPTSMEGRAKLAWAIFVWVGVGYAVRGGSGLLAGGVGWSSHPSEFYGMSLFLIAFGAMFVTFTWALESCSYCLEAPIDEQTGIAKEGVVILPSLRERPHLLYLLQRRGVVRVKDADSATVLSVDAAIREAQERHILKGPLSAQWKSFTRSPKGANRSHEETRLTLFFERRRYIKEQQRLRRNETSTIGARTKLLWHRDRSVTPWNVLTIMACMAAVVVGHLLTGTDIEIVRSFAFGLIMGASISCVRSTRLRAFLAALFLVVLSFGAQDSMDALLLMLLPPLMTLGVAVFFRDKSYRDLKVDLEIHWKDLGSSMLAKVLGQGAFDSLTNRVKPWPSG
jgi:hypothetical protein